MTEQLLNMQRQVAEIKLKWVMAPWLVTLAALIWQHQFFTGWVLIPFILSIAVTSNYMVAQQRAKRLQKINDLRIDAIFWQPLQQQYPQLSLKQRRLIEQGFKDYLALHAMQNRAFAMPSHAVDALWHAMLTFPDRYDKLCKDTIGKPLIHRPYVPNASTADAAEQEKQLLEAWRYSCMLHGFDPRNASSLPRLFAIDAALAWSGGQIFDLQQLRTQYAEYLRDQSSSSSSCGSNSSCSSCGGGGD